MFLFETLHDENFQDLHKVRPQDFTRCCPLDFPTLFCFMTNLRHCSTTKELNTFFHNLTGDRDRAVTASAFQHSRKKLRPSAFRDMLHRTCDFLYERHPGLETWFGLRLCAVDGSDIQLPDVPGLREHFDPKADPRAVPVARLSLCFDVLNGIPLDMVLAPQTDGERECLVEHLDRLGPDDLLLMDMGYPAQWLFRLLEERGLRFCIRAKTGFNRQVARFVESGQRERIVDLEANELTREKAAENDFEPGSVRVRLVRVDLPDGTIEVLITNLLDGNAWPHDLFENLYGHRWGVETVYDHAKQWAEIECFSGKHVNAVMQDVYAKIFAIALTAMVVIEVHPRIDSRTAHRKLSYQLNWSDALAAMRNWGMLFIVRVRDLRRELSQLLERFMKAPAPIRPGRRFPRRKRVTPRKYSIPRQAIS